MSLELGRSSAARDDEDEESTEADDPTAATGANEPRPDDATADGPPHRSVLAPFMAAGSADDPLPDKSSARAASDTGRQDDTPRRGDTISPATPGAGGATAGPSGDDKTPAARDAGTTPRANPGASGASGRAYPAATAEESATGARPGDAEAAPASNAGGTTAPSVPRQGDANDRGTSGASSAGSAPAGAVRREKAGADLDGPLLENAEELRANWLRLQAGFVDDPRDAVSDAADLVEHAAQALVGAMRLRQQKLREMWDSGRTKTVKGQAHADEDWQGAEPTTAAADTTEQLRLLMQRYRLLFNHICRS